MNKLRLHFASAILIIVVIAGIFNACSRDTLTQDLNISLGSEFLVNPISFQVSDAVTENNLKFSVFVVKS